MTNFLKSTFFFIGLICFAIACEDDRSLTPNPSFNGAQGSSGAIRAEFNGEKFEAKVVGASRIGGLINITGQADKYSITITLDDQGVATYSLDDNSLLSAMALSDGSQFDSFTSNRDSLSGGTVKIASIDESNKTMSGTFEARLRKEDSTEVIVTNGEFIDVKYTTETNTGGGSSNNSFSAKVDGVDWNANSITAVVNGGKLGVTGISNNSEQSIILFLPPETPTGTFNLVTFGEYDAQFHLTSQGLVKTAESGTVTIESHEIGKEISGSFSFVAGGGAFAPMDSVDINITEGKFKAAY